MSLHHRVYSGTLVNHGVGVRLALVRISVRKGSDGGPSLVRDVFGVASLGLTRYLVVIRRAFMVFFECVDCSHYVVRNLVLHPYLILPVVQRIRRYQHCLVSELISILKHAWLLREVVGLVQSQVVVVYKLHKEVLEAPPAALLGVLLDDLVIGVFVEVVDVGP